MQYSANKQEFSHVAAIVIAVVLAIGVVVVDTNCPPDLSLFVFNIVPTILVAWYVGRGPAYALAICCGIVYLGADWVIDRTHSRPYIPFLQVGMKVPLFLMVAYLASRLKLALAHEKRLARTDSLTGLLNSGSFTELVDMEVSRSRRVGKPFSLVYMDIDDFKSVNDTHGHVVGDAVLRTVADSIRSHIRDMDSAGRMGGDEIAILLPETNEETARQAVTRLRVALDTVVRANSWPVSFSVGVVTWNVGPENAMVAIRAVDQAMYDVKQSGKSDVRFLVLERQ